MKKKYITPSISVEKMDVPFLIQTSKIPIVTDEPKPLDGKVHFDDFDEDDLEIGFDFPFL
jgi:hypothetical protein